MAHSEPHAPQGPPLWRPEDLHPAFPLVGMVHLPPLPGAPDWAGPLERVLERAREDARHLEEAGFDGILVENFGDRPFHPGAVPPETVAALAVAVDRIRATTSLRVGVNVLRNDAGAALGIAAATGASYIRVNVHAGTMHTDQGLLEGEAHRTLRRRKELGLSTGILADVFVKHAVPPVGWTLEEAARDTCHRGGADVLLVSGSGTGEAPEGEAVRQVRDAVPDAPIWLASGLTPENASTLAPSAHGAIVGSSVQWDGTARAGVDPARAGALVAALKARREARASPGPGP